MTGYQTRHPLFLPRLLCTGALMITGAMLVLAWTTRHVSFDPVSVAIVFAAALIGRILLVERPHLGAQQAAATGRPARDLE